MPSRGFRRAIALVREASLTGLAILLIYALGFLLDATLGRDAVFFDFLPVRFLLDGAHVLVLLRFVYEAAKELTRP